MLKVSEHQPDEVSGAGSKYILFEARESHVLPMASNAGESSSLAGLKEHEDEDNTSAL